MSEGATPRAREPAGIRIATNQQEHVVDPATATEAVMQGRATILGETQLVSMGDRILRIPTRNLGKALNRGWQLIDDDGAAKIRMRREESGAAGTAIGAVESVASGLTLGLSRVAERAAGVDPERMAAREESVGGAGAALEFVGAAAPAVLTGGAGAAARVAAATPAGALMRAGAAAEGAIARGMSRVAVPELVRKAAPLAGRGAVEGFGFGAGAQISEDVLGDRELALDRTLGAGAMGAILGGGANLLFGAALGTARAAGRQSARGARSAAKVLRNAVGSPSEGVPNVIERALAKGDVDGVESVLGLPKGTLKPIAEDLATPQGRDSIQALIDAPARVEETMAAGLRSPTEGVRDAVLEMRKTISSYGKMKQAAAQIPEEKRAAAVMASGDIVDGFRAHLAKAMEHNAAAGRTAYDDFTLLELDRLAQGAQQQIAETFRFGSKNIGLTYDAVDGLVRQADAQMRSLYKAASMGDLQAQRTVELFSGRRALDGVEAPGTISGMRQFLRDSTIWGGRGDAQKAVNDAVGTAIKQREGLLDTATRRVLDDRKHAVMDKDVLSILHNSSRMRGAQAYEQFEETIVAELNAARTIAQHYETTPAFKAALVRGEQALEAWRGAAKEQGLNQAKLDTLNLLKNRGQQQTLGAVGAGAVGGLVGGLPGAAIGAAASFMRNPWSLLRSYLGMMRTIDRASGMYRSAVEPFLQRMGPKAARLAQRAGPPLAAIGRTARVGLVKLSAAQRRERNEKAIEAARRYATDPAQLDEAVRGATINLLDMAPDMAGAAHGRAMSASMFLMSKTPIEFSDPFSKEKPLVDPIAMAKLDRYTDAVVAPMEVVAKLADGTFTSEHAEALAAVYPGLYADLQSLALEAASNADFVPYDVRLMVRTLFNTNIDATTRPGFIRRTQAALNMPPVKRPTTAQSGAMASSGMKMTQAQKLERGLDAD